MKIKDILELGGKNRTKAIMTSRVMVATGDSKLVDFAGKLWDLIVDTDYLRASVHGVLVEGYSHKEASEIYGDKKSYLRNLVGTESTRLEKDLGMDIYPVLIGEEEIESRGKIDALLQVVEGLIGDSEHLEESVFDGITIDIRNKKSYRETNLSDAEFIDFVRDNDYLSKEKIKNQVKGLDESDIGYIIYLLRTKSDYLTEKDKTRKELVKEVWWL